VLTVILKQPKYLHKLVTNYQQTIAVRAEQICNHRPCQHSKSHYWLGRGDSYRPGTWRRQLSAGNLIGQPGGSGWTSESDRKATTSWTETRGSSCCPTSTMTYYSPQLRL